MAPLTQSLDQLLKFRHTGAVLEHSGERKRFAFGLSPREELSLAVIMPLVSAMAVSNVGVNRIADSVIRRGFGVSRKRLARLLSRSNKALRDGIQLSEAITGDGAAIFRHACWMDPERYRLEADRLPICERPDACMAEDEEPEFRAAVSGERA